MSKTKILIVAGGTGGHIYPARAVADYLSNKAKILYLEKKIISSPKNIFKLIFGFFQSILIFLSFRPHAVFLTGGYPALPTGIAAFLFKTPIILQEQNVFLGKTNRFLARFAKEVFFETPVRKEIFAVSNKIPFEKRDTILIFGGSQGAESINKAVEKMDLSELNVIHITGKGLPQNNGSYKQLPFAENMAPLYENTCLAVCRAGGSSLAELSICGIPAILIPYPYAAENHQQANAEKFSKAGAAVIIENLYLDKLESIMKMTYSDKKKLKMMSDNMKKLSDVETCDKIWQLLKKVI